MKDILSKRYKLIELDTVTLSKACSMLIRKGIPKKLKDPGNFTIPCTIENEFFGKALCDHRTILNYCIQNGFSINIGRVIQNSILKTIKSYLSVGLGHPLLISSLCISCGVEAHSSEEL